MASVLDSHEGNDPTFLLNSKHSMEAGLKPKVVHHNLSVCELYEMALRWEPGTHVVNSGALATVSGEKTGRPDFGHDVVGEKHVCFSLGSPLRARPNRPDPEKASPAT